MVFDLLSSPVSTDAGTQSDTESAGEIGVCEFSPRMGLAGPFSLASTDSDTESRGTVAKVVFRLDLVSDQVKRKALGLLSTHAGVHSIFLDVKTGKCALVGCHIDPIQVMCILQKKICPAEIVSVTLATRNDSFSETARITELQENSENQQEDQTPPRQANSLISKAEALPVSCPLPPLSLPLASDAQPSSSPVSRPSRGTSNQMQAAADHAPELSFPFAPLSSRTFRTEGLADSPAQSSICGGACLPKAKNLMEEKGLGGHDQLYDSAVDHLLSRGYDLRAGEQASRLKQMEDTAIMLRKKVEELKAKVSMADMRERRLMHKLCISEERHDRTKRELALMQEKMDEADRRIEYLEAAVSRYQNRIVVAEAEKEKAEERAHRASVEGGTMSTLCLSPADPRSTSLSFVPSPSPRLPDLEGGKKLVVKIDLHDGRDKKKAMKLVSGFLGIGYMAIDMKARKMTVCGVMDSVEVVNKLRKSWCAEIVSVGSAKEDYGKKDEGKKNEDIIKAYQAYYSPRSRWTRGQYVSEVRHAVDELDSPATLVFGGRGEEELEEHKVEEDAGEGGGEEPPCEVGGGEVGVGDGEDSDGWVRSRGDSVEEGWVSLSPDLDFIAEEMRKARGFV